SSDYHDIYYLPTRRSSDLRRLSSIRNTGCPEVFPSPSKVVAFEYKIINNRWFRGERAFSVFNHQFPSYTSPNILIPLTSFLRIRSEEHTSELQSRLDIICR